MDRDMPKPDRRRAQPPLADTAATDPRAARPVLADGCYLVYFNVTGLDEYVLEGTLRVETKDGQRFASGDLYRQPNNIYRLRQPIGGMTPPERVTGIPSFPIKNYRYYLKATQIEESEDSCNLVFEVHRFSTVSAETIEGLVTNWALEGIFTAQLTKTKATDVPVGYPRPELFFVGQVSNEVHTFGDIQIGWVSPLLRKATLEIDSVPKSAPPRDNGAGLDWQKIFAAVGWDLEVSMSSNDVTKPDGPVWTAADAHAALLARRDRSDLDAEWRYYILAVELIKYDGGERGVMYDKGSIDDVNQVSREGLMVSSDFVFPMTEERWGKVRGKRAADTQTYFRTAVHELGHAMGLDHDRNGTAFMRPTDGIADVSGGAFPDNITWGFSPLTERQLRHWPDVVVRPGGLSYGAGPDAPLRGAGR